MKTILTLVGKDLALLKKDKLAITMSLIVPFVIIYIMGNIFGGAGNNNGPSEGIGILVADYADTPATRKFIEILDSDEGLKVIRQYKEGQEGLKNHTEKSIREFITNNKQRFGLIIPKDALADRIGVSLKFLHNPVNQIESQMVTGLLQKNVFMNLPTLLGGQLIDQVENFSDNQSYDNYSDEMATLVNKYFDVEVEDVKSMMSVDNLRDKIGAFEATDATDSRTQNADTDEKGFSDLISQIVDIEEDQVVGKEVKNPQVTRMIGGYAIMFLLFAVNASASSLFEEKRMGIFHRLLSMPMQRTHILWSKYIYNMGFGLAQLLILFFGSSLLFEVDIYSNFLNLIIVSFFASAACTSFGMLLAAVSKTPQQAQGLGTFVIIIMSSVGGAWFPVSIMPEFIQVFSKLTIVYWSVESLTDTLWANASLVQLGPKIGVLFLITVTVNAVSIWRFKKGDLFH